MVAPRTEPGFALSSPRSLAATLLLLVAVLGILIPSKSQAGSGPEESAGKAIYQDGVLSSGGLIEGRREGGSRLEGAEAACVNCHRRSGFGAREGRIVIPPIAGQYLLRSTTPKAGNEYVPYVETMRLDHEPSYSEETFAKAVREGVDAQGRPFDYLMPRYTLDDADIAALIDYLKRLGQRKLPGVTDTTLDFATIVTPDADPLKRRGMLDVIEHYFADRNLVQMAPSERLHSSRQTSWVGHMVMVHRRWRLHEWQLTGPADTWEAQLKQHFAREPVLAVVSGLGGKNWEPVHAFCEHEAVPCLFPNVEVPPAGADRDFFSLYFSKGVRLEAELIANRIIASGARAVHEIYRAGDSGEAAAGVLETALQARGIAVQRNILARGKPGRGISRTLRQAAHADALVLWLRPSDIRALPPAPEPGMTAYMSGIMGGLEGAPLPPGWLARTYIAYPFDLPENRRVPMDYALGWFSIRHIPIVDEQVQADTFLACGLLSEALSHMADNFVPEYLVERVQDMIEHRLITGYYPHLALAQGQRFASKGGYIAHVDDRQGRRHLVADSEWLVP